MMRRIVAVPHPGSKTVFVIAALQATIILGLASMFLVGALFDPDPKSRGIVLMIASWFGMAAVPAVGAALLYRFRPRVGSWAVLGGEAVLFAFGAWLVTLVASSPDPDLPLWLWLLWPVLPPAAIAGSAAVAIGLELRVALRAVSPTDGRAARRT